MKQYALPAAIGVIAILILFAALIGFGSPSSSPQAVTEAPEADPPKSSTFSSQPVEQTFSGVAERGTAAPASSEQSAESGSYTDSVEATLEAIDDAAYTFSPKALPFLAGKLNSPDPEIREAAIDGIKLLSDPAGIQVLRRAAKSARNEEERSKLLEAANWLALPDWQPAR